MSKLVTFYMRMLERHPLTTQALTAGVLMASGDGLAQFAVEQKSIKEYSFERTLRFFIFGTVILGPTLKNWYGLLDKIVKRPPPVGVFMKIGLDQALFAPTFCCFFLGSMTLWTSHSVDVSIQKIKQDYITVLIANYKLWPAAQFINFYFVPLHLRVLYASFVSLFWNTYLAYKASQGVTEDIAESPFSSNQQ